MNSFKLMKVITEAYKTNIVTEMTIAGDIANASLALHNEKRIRNIIISKYPTSDDLKLKLLQINTPKSIRLAKKLPPGMNPKQYCAFINQHFGGRTFWRWLWVILGQEFSLAFQTLKSINMSNNADEHIINKVY